MDTAPPAQRAKMRAAALAKKKAGKGAQGGAARQEEVSAALGRVEFPPTR